MVATLASSQNINLICAFTMNGLGEYVCTIRESEVLDQTANVVFTGEHLDERSDQDVVYVRILSSNTPFIINQIFTTFPNVVKLEVESSNLQSVRLPENADLEWIVFWGNNISRIDADSFTNQRRLESLRLTNNGIKELDEDAFQDLESLIFAAFINNRIREIAPRTFHALVNALTIDLEGNQLTTIGNDIFVNNRRLARLYLERNQIESISPTLSSNLNHENLDYINLSGNRCATRFFYLRDDFDREMFNLALQPCFRNFMGDEPRQISVQFTGNLTIFDQFENVIVRL